MENNIDNTNVDTQQQQNEEKTFTQADIDRAVAEATKDMLSQDKVNEIVEKRLAREREKIMESNDSDGIMACYDLAARLISCNQSGLQVTAEELRGKYALDLYGLIFFFNAYSDFIIEIQNAKN